MDPSLLESLIRIKFRQGTAAVWTSQNPVLASGEPGIETDTGLEKRGNGYTPWRDLPYSTEDPANTVMTAAAGISVRGADGTITSKTEYIEEPLTLTVGLLIQNPDGSFEWVTVPHSGGVPRGYDGGDVGSNVTPPSFGYDGGDLGSPNTAVFAGYDGGTL